MGFFRRNKKKDKAVAEPETATVASSAVTQPDDEDYVPTIPSGQAVELGTINYVNLTRDGRHGEFDIAVRVARETGRPIFANFVEWSG